MGFSVTILGCGASGGVPLIGCDCGVCQSVNPKNKRLRTSVLVDYEETRLLVDTSPDLRQQAVNAGISTVDAILYTHTHADHCHGIDDARSFNFNSKQVIPAYGMPETLEDLKARFSYVFNGLQFGDHWYRPALKPITVGDYEAFSIGNVPVQSFLQYHGKGRNLGYRIGNFAYSTDVNNLPEQSLQLLDKLDVWVVDCLQYEPSPTHSHLGLTLEWIDRLKPRQAILTHMNHYLDYEALANVLPSHVVPAYDGLRIIL